MRRRKEKGWRDAYGIGSFIPGLLLHPQFPGRQVLSGSSSYLYLTMRSCLRDTIGLHQGYPGPTLVLKFTSVQIPHSMLSRLLMELLKIDLKSINVTTPSSHEIGTHPYHVLVSIWLTVYLSMSEWGQENYANFITKTIDFHIKPQIIILRELILL